MDRLKLIKGLIKKRKYRNYLEIGVFNGHILFRIKSKMKIAVDPAFRFTWSRKWGKILLNPNNLRNTYFEKTSDAFFGEDAERVFGTGRKVHIALIDGMHEYAYALRDVENTLRYLDDGGVIVMHDCNPITADAAVSFEAWNDKKSGTPWNGDVWKTIIYLRSMRKDIHVLVLECDQGLGIIMKGEPENMLNFTEEEIRSFTYDDLQRNRTAWLNLKPAEYARTFFGL